jgi:CRP-like cAMP-binding protein
MPLDWLNTPLDADIGDLIARKKRAKTIELLRSQLQGRMVPPVQMRLQLADLLVQSGRESEAVPVLIGLADEFAGDGFVAKAIAILKRVDRVQPGREDVEARLARLVKLQRSAPPPPVRGRPPLPEFGIEEIPDEPAVTPAAPAPEDAPADAAASSADSAPDEESVRPVDEAAPETLPDTTAVAAAEAPPPPADTDASQRVRGVFRRFLASLPGAAGSEATAPDTVAGTAGPPVVAEVEETRPDSKTGVAGDEIAPPSEPATPAAPAEAVPAEDGDDPITARYAPYKAEDSAPPEEPRAAPEPAAIAPSVPAATATPSPEVPQGGSATARSPDGGGAAGSHGVAGRIRGAFRWLVASLATPAEETTAATGQEGPAPGSRPSAEAAAAPEPAAAAPSGEAAGGAGAAETPAAEEEPMSDEAFQERLLDLVQDILHRPDGRKASPAAAPLDRRLVLRYAQRLLATALFGDLSEEELLAVVRGLRLHLHGPGDILVTEGERGQSVFVLAAGAARVSVRSPSGRNFPVAELRDGDFFGEISSLSGRPRSATVTAAERCELLELDRPTLDEIARAHPRVADVLEEFYIRRASSPEAAAVRAVPTNDAGAEKKAIEVLEAHFGQGRWDPRMRLRLADVLLKAGKYQDAVPVLIGLADDLARAGYSDKAIAVLKKIERIQRRDVEVVNLAPLARTAPAADAGASPGARAGAAPSAPRPAWAPQATAEFFQGWLEDVLRDRAQGRGEGGGPSEAERSALASIRGYGPGLLASPLFEDFADDELLAVIRGLRLLTFEAGDIIVTEGEPGQSLFVLTTGTVKVFIRDPAGRNVALCPLGEGAFFGEIATLSGRPRSATVTAASRCELLELDKPALDAIVRLHPHVRDVLEEHYIARATDPEAAAIRGTTVQGSSEPG